MMTLGRHRVSRSLVEGDSTAPPEPKAISDETSKRAPSASSSSTSGRAMASPTTTTALTDSSPTRRHTAAGSNWPPGSVTTVPPPSRLEKTSQWPLACMKGGMASATMPTGRMRPTSSAGAVM